MKPKLRHILRIRAILLWHHLARPYNRWRASKRKPIEPNVKTGQRFSITENFDTSGLTTWSAPYTGDFRCEVPRGTTFEAIHDSVPTAIGFACKPVNYDEFERVYVPESDRVADKYGGYYFVFKKSDIGGLLIAAS